MLIEMAHFRYLIVGGGMAADAAVNGIRSVDSEGTIGLISEESHPPYKRPPLSKKLWQGKPLESIWLETESPGVELLLGRRVVHLDLDHKQVVDDRGTVYTFEQLLLATGGTPRRLAGDHPQIIYFRTLDDYLRLRSLTERGNRFAVLGGGFIGSEIAAALTLNGKEVILLFPEEGIGARLFPRDLALFLNEFYRQKGVVVQPGELVIAVEEAGSKQMVRTQSGRSWEVDGVVAGLGIVPNVEIAQAAGLAVENGIVVDELLRTSHSEVYAAGDNTNFYSSALGIRLRVEHEDNAIAQGFYAGQNMAGEAVSYRHLPFFYSDLFELGYEAVGELDPRLEVVADWEEPYRKGILYYRQGDQVRGVLLWNVWGKLDWAREVIHASPQRPSP